MTVQIFVYKFLFTIVFFGKRKKTLTKPLTFWKWKHISKKNHILEMKVHSKTHFGNESSFQNPFWKWKHVFWEVKGLVLFYVYVIHILFWSKFILGLSKKFWTGSKVFGHGHITHKYRCLWRLIFLPFELFIRNDKKSEWHGQHPMMN